MITVITLFPIALVGLMMCLLPALVPPTLPFAVRIPPSRVDEPVVGRQRRRYFWGTGLVAAAGTAGAAFVSEPLRPVVAAAVLLVCLAFFSIARQAIRSAKEAEGWYLGLTQAIATDTTWRSRRVRFPWWWALPAPAILIGTALTGALRYPHLPDRIATHFDGEGVADQVVATSVTAAFTGVFLQAFVTVLIVGLLALSYRSRPATDAADPAGSTERYRRFLSALGPAILVLAALVNVCLLLASLQIWQLIPVTPVTLGLTAGIPLLGVVVLIAVAIRLGQAGARLNGPAPPAKGEAVVNRDDDANWKGGLFYVNRQDPSLLVPRRFGVGWTLNLARPVAWAILVVPFAVIVLMGLLAH